MDIPNIEGDRYSITAFNCDTVQLSDFEYDGLAIQANCKEKLKIAYIKFNEGSFRGSNQSRNAGTLSVGSAYNVGSTGYISI